jgi:hypothetical protein
MSVPFFYSIDSLFLPAIPENLQPRTYNLIKLLSSSRKQLLQKVQVVIQ